MAAGTFTLYDGAGDLMFKAADSQWDDATAGEFMWALCTSAYTPVVTHADMTDITGEIVPTADGDPQNTGARSITTTGSIQYFSCGDANFGAAVTITAQYLLLIKPATAATFVNDATCKLVGYCDLNVGGSDLSSTAGDFVVTEPTSPSTGWFSINMNP